MNWNDKQIEKMYNRIKKEAIDRGIDETRLDSPYLTKLSKETKSLRIKQMIEEAYYLGMMRGIHYVDEMKTPIFLRDQEVCPPPDNQFLLLEDIDRKGNVLKLTFKDKKINRIEIIEIHLAYNVYVLDYDDLDYEQSDAKNGVCPILIVNPTIWEECWYPSPELVFSSKNSFKYYYGAKYTDIMKELEPFKFIQKEFPEDKKIVDFEKQGNQVKFYLGNIDCNDYYGDDWNDTPYEHNAGPVYDRYFDDEWVISFPYNVTVFEPADGCDNSAYCKNDMRNMDVPCIVYLEDNQNCYKFSQAVLAYNSHKIYFNDTAKTVDI